MLRLALVSNICFHLIIMAQTKLLVFLNRRRMILKFTKTGTCWARSKESVDIVRHHLLLLERRMIWPVLPRLAI